MGRPKKIDESTREIKVHDIKSYSEEGKIKNISVSNSHKLYYYTMYGRDSMVEQWGMSEVEAKEFENNAVMKAYIEYLNKNQNQIEMTDMLVTRDTLIEEVTNTLLVNPLEAYDFNKLTNAKGRDTIIVQPKPYDAMPKRVRDQIENIEIQNGTVKYKMKSKSDARLMLAKLKNIQDNGTMAVPIINMGAISTPKEKAEKIRLIKKG